METIFTALLFFLMLLFYFSDRHNKVNRWCALMTFFGWLGVAKESVLFNIVPYVKYLWGYTIPDVYYQGAYSAMTWALYSLIMPTAVIFSLYFCNMDRTHSKLMGNRKLLIYAPALVLSFWFPPLAFRGYQLSSLPFWIAYGIYNLSLGVVFTCLMIRGVRIEKPGKAKKQKKLVRLILLPPILYWLITLFFTHPFRLTKLFKLWQGNTIILLVCIVIYIFTAFKDGFMGLRLSRETYQWNSDLSIINKGAEYTSHMLKNQTSKMEWCIENLKAQFDSAQEEASLPEELAILSRSIVTLKGYTDKIKKYSEAIHLFEEPCHLKTLLESSLQPFVKVSRSNITMQIFVQDDMFWLCDQTHMSEVFVNIFSNAAEATLDCGTVEITGKFDRSEHFYLLSFTDHGIGMCKEDVKNMFTPYFTTKNTDHNFGLGLAYCKSVVEKHGGYLKAVSEPETGATVTIAFPVKRITLDEEATKMEAKNA